MKYTRQALIDHLHVEDPPKYLFFWGHTPSLDGSIRETCFSQWWQGHPFEEAGIVYASAEHYMMAGKARLFDDQQRLQQILASSHPDQAKKLGRQVVGFDQAVWEAKRCEIVIQGNFLKFSQHPVLQHYLLNTGNRIIVEASPLDRIWGIGLGKAHSDAANPARWQGENLLGFCLMEVRDMLRED